MPTGYTCNIQDGTMTELKDYMLGCSRNFGALIHMREDNSNNEIRHRECSDYHLKQLNRTKDDYENFKKLTDEKIQITLDKNYENIIEEHKNSLKRFEEGKQRYLDMLTKVKTWNSPTEEHNKLKEFAIKQIEDSLDFDYSDSLRSYYLVDPIKDTVEAYKQFKLKSYLKDTEYHSKGYKEEIEGVQKVNTWIDDLINSFE